MIRPLQLKGRLSPAKLITLSLLTIFTLPSMAQTWPVIGNESQVAVGVSNYTSITTVEIAAGDDSYVSVPYVAFTESGIAKVKRLINGAWESVGGNVSEGNASYTYIFSDANGKVYLNYVDASATGANRLAVKTYNASTSAWEPLGGISGNLYLSAGSILQNNGTALNGSHNSWMSFDSNNVPYVIFSDFSLGGNPYVKRFIGAAWETVGAGPVSTDKAPGVGITIDQTTNTPFIVYLAGSGTVLPLKVMSYTGTTWSSIAFPVSLTVNGATSGSVSAARHSAIALDGDNNLSVAYFNASNSNRATVIKYNRATSEWSLSGSLSGRDASYINITKGLNGDLYTSFIDIISSSVNIPTCRVFKLPAGTTTWKELVHASATYGIDDQSQNIFLAASANNKEYVVYTRTNSSSVVTPVVRLFSAEAPPPPPPPGPDPVVSTPKQMELLNRGLVAVRLNSTQVYLSWRMFGTDPSGIAFNVYRDGAKLNSSPITTSTNYTDNASSNGIYTIKPVINGVEQTATSPVSVWNQNYLNIPLQIPAGGITPAGEAYTYNANDASVGDLDGDGEYEIVLKWDPSNSKDNSQSGYTGNVYLDAYKLNGTRLWRINLGRNIRAGAHYTQFLVYDLDGDGYAEVACKTADGTVDGAGTVIGDANADFRNSSGYILSGPEYMTVFNGRTGAAMATKNYLPARGTVSSWGDGYGNRVDRFIAAVAYVDGARPTLIMGRGYYTRMVRAAWDWRDGQLTSRWVFDSNSSGNGAYYGQGNHQMTIGDVDGDGKDEIFNGSSAINDNGSGLWTDGKGHGDALHMSDMDPSVDGQEIWMCHEDQSSYGGTGLTLRKAKTGELLWGVQATGDIGRAMAADIDPRYPGYELWGATGGNVYSSKGVPISTNVPSFNFAIWWDGDLSRELLDGTKLDKWNTATNSSTRLFSIHTIETASQINGTKANPCVSADILGDWREEMVYRSADNTNLILFTTNIPTTHRIPTLMHDPQYRVAVAWQNAAYNQPPHPGFFLGTDMATPSVPNITLAVAQPITPVITPAGAATLCTGSELMLTSSVSTGNQWFKDGVAIANATGTSYSVTASGAYTVKSTNLCCSSAPSVAVNVTLAALPSAIITAGGPLNFFTGGSVILNANTGTGFTYRWKKDGTEISNARTSSYTAMESGSYTVSITSGQCQSVSQPAVVTKMFSLPASNFRVAVNAESCKESNNGKIVITAAENLNYTATLTSNGASSQNTFNNTLTISNLSAGNYSLCITVSGQPTYSQCFNDLVVKEPADLSVYSSIDGLNNTINLNLSGSKIYHITLNGRNYSTEKSIIELPLIKGNNSLKVSTENQCQGVFEKIVTLNDKAIVYPNPFENTLNLKLGTEESQKVVIEVKSTDGKQVFKKQYFNADGTISLELSHLAKGVYVLKLSLDNSESFYKILKQ
ncbi:MAG: T9SS type A sorting domain-containing protein [Sphingobacteriaceae bacterium]|nr:T9SS type A sorting domain-containing protein [Sphingobacteriaceae bacterium]